MIVAATTEDAQAITDLWNDIITTSTITFTTVQKTRDQIAQLVADPARCVLVARQGDAFMGFAMISPFRSGPGYVHTTEHTIYMRPEAKGQGHGKQLMRSLERAAYDLGHHVMIGAMNCNNLDSIRFHESLEFQQVAVIPEAGVKNGIWYDMVLMHKILKTATDMPRAKG